MSICLERMCNATRFLQINDEVLYKSSIRWDDAVSGERTTVAVCMTLSGSGCQATVRLHHQALNTDLSSLETETEYAMTESLGVHCIATDPSCEKANHVISKLLVQ